MNFAYLCSEFVPLEIYRCMLDRTGYVSTERGMLTEVWRTSHAVGLCWL